MGQGGGLDAGDVTLTIDGATIASDSAIGGGGGQGVSGGGGGGTIGGNFDAAGGGVAGGGGGQGGLGLGGGVSVIDGKLTLFGDNVGEDRADGGAGGGAGVGGNGGDGNFGNGDGRGGGGGDGGSGGAGGSCQGGGLFASDATLILNGTTIAEDLAVGGAGGAGNNGGHGGSGGYYASLISVAGSGGDGGNGGVGGAGGSGLGGGLFIKAGTLTLEGYRSPTIRRSVVPPTLAATAATAGRAVTLTASVEMAVTEAMEVKEMAAASTS